MKESICTSTWTEGRNKGVFVVTHYVFHSSSFPTVQNIPCGYLLSSNSMLSVCFNSDQLAYSLMCLAFRFKLSICYFFQTLMGNKINVLHAGLQDNSLLHTHNYFRFKTLNFIAHKIVFLLSRDRVVLIVTRLWDRRFVVRILAGVRDLFLLYNIHTLSEVQLAYY
jgi:hypothetical protein